MGVIDGHWNSLHINYCTFLRQSDVLPKNVLVIVKLL